MALVVALVVVVALALALAAGLAVSPAVIVLLMCIVYSHKWHTTNRSSPCYAPSQFLPDKLPFPILLPGTVQRAKARG